MQPLSVSNWLGMLSESASNPALLSPHGDPLPRFPTDDLQLGTTGLAGIAALKQAAAFYADICDTANRCGKPLDAQSKIMDFGSGWGRITRFFMRDTPLRNIAGVEVDASFVDLSNSLFGGNSFHLCTPMPPSEFQAGSFDLVAAYSVFSHLSPDAAKLWVDEFARVLKSGGLFAFTTRDESFFDVCIQLGRMGNINSHQNVLAHLFPDFEAARKRYRAGEFVHKATGGGGPRDAEFYGESFIPRAYVESVYGKDFEVVFASSTTPRGELRKEVARQNAEYDQACFILRRR